MNTNAWFGTSADSVQLAAHPNFSDEVNRNILQSEIEGGVHLRDLPPSSVLSIQTRNRVYTLVVLSDDNVLISGHPQFCPEPAEVRINGSTWGGSMIKSEFIGRGMHLEFGWPEHLPITTSLIVEVRSF